MSLSLLLMYQEIKVLSTPRHGMLLPVKLSVLV